ncbi:hypothetical protein G3M53_57235 [Streptomyces sp. SID7982]|nr:hypothetical protein [Streptomyces sp. SID7982]
MTDLVAQAALPLEVRRYPQHFTSEERADAAFTWPAGGPDLWGENCCGLACLRMLLGYFDLAVPSQRSLLARGLELGAYTPKGWHHQGLVNLAEPYGLTGAAVPYDSPQSLQRLALLGIPTIVSVTFRLPEDGRKGGHLVLFLGETVHADRRQAAFADPSRWGAEHHEVPADRFWASWTGRAVVLWPTARNPADLPEELNGITSRKGDAP